MACLLHHSRPFLISSSLPSLTPNPRLIACLSLVEASRTDLSAAKPPSPPPVPTPPATTTEDLNEPIAKSWVDHPEYRRWKDQEEEILKDIEGIRLLTKHILHSNKYMDGECLSPDDEKEVTEKLLAYHPHSEDKIGSGINSIMVDRHPAFRNSRCLFVVRTDGGWIDFSYQKCLRAYIRKKYPAYAERFLREHFKRT